MANETNPTPPSPQPAPTPPPPPPRHPGKPTGADEEIRVYQHAGLFYWWPVWFFGFLFALLTYLGDHHMAIVPVGTKAVAADAQGHDRIVLDAKHKLVTRKDENGKVVPADPTIYVTQYHSMGTFFLLVLLIVVFITNISLRGLWSLVVVISIVMSSIILYLAGYSSAIIDRLTNLSIYINLGGYLLMALSLFALWMFNMFFLDRQLYVVFTPGQVRMRLEIGGGEMIYDTTGLVVQKQRSDFFRHWILGFGTGDLILRFPKTDHPVELHNILFITKTLRKIEQLVQEKVVNIETAPK